MSERPESGDAEFTEDEDIAMDDESAGKLTGGMRDRSLRSEDPHPVKHHLSRR